MAAMNDANTRDLLIDYMVRLADAICGEEDTPYDGGDLMRHSMKRIVEYFEENPISGGDDSGDNEEDNGDDSGDDSGDGGEPK